MRDISPPNEYDVIEYYLPYGKFDGPEYWYAWGQKRKYIENTISFSIVRECFLYRRRYWKNYHLHGVDEQYYPDGTLRVQNNWDEGIRHGHYILRGINGCPLRDSNWVYGYRDGRESKYVYDAGIKPIFDILIERIWDRGQIISEIPAERYGSHYKKHLKTGKLLTYKSFDYHEIGVRRPLDLPMELFHRSLADAGYKYYGELKVYPNGYFRLDVVPNKFPQADTMNRLREMIQSSYKPNPLDLL